MNPDIKSWTPPKDLDGKHLLSPEAVHGAARPHGPLMLVVDYRAATPSHDCCHVPNFEMLEPPNLTPPLPRKSLPKSSVRWVASAKTLPELHRRLGYLIRRKRVQP